MRRWGRGAAWACAAFAVALGPFLGLAQATISGCALDTALTALPNSGAAIDFRTAKDGWFVGSQGPWGDCEAEGFPLAEHWDGTRWTKTPVPAGGSCPQMGLTGVFDQSVTSAWAIGQGLDSWPLAYHWNGVGWVYTTLPHTATSLAAVDGAPGSHVWVAGYGVYRHSSHRWVQVGKGQVSGLSVLSDSDVWVTGACNWASQRCQTLVRHWNGTRWSTLRTPNPGVSNGFTAIAARSRTNVWAVGFTEPRIGAPARTLIAHWNGKRWARIPSPHPGGSDGDILQSIALNPHAGAWAAGYQGLQVYRQPNREFTSRALVLHWIAGRWTIVPSPSVAGNTPPVGIGQGDFLTGVSALPNGGAVAVGSSHIHAANGNPAVDESLAMRCSSTP
jgi:hypothetical protein